MQVKQFNAGLYDANSYLVNGRILIDTGINTSALLAEIERNINIEELELIILTHCHFDHSAAALEIAKRSGAKIAIHKDDAPLLKDNSASASAAFGYKAPDFDPDTLLEEGEEIQIGDGEVLEVVHTPGHTPGGICLYERVSKSLFSGDTVFPNGSIGRTDFEGGNRKKIVDSIEKLVLLDVAALYPGHGMVTTSNVNFQIEQSLKMSRSILL